MWRYLFALLVAGSPAFACGCVGTEETVREAWKDRPYVFLGTVVVAIPDTDQSFTPHVAHVRVDEAFKGVTKGQMLELHQGGTSCDAHFRTGERAVFYLLRTGGRFHILPCRISTGSADHPGIPHPRPKVV